MIQSISIYSLLLGIMLFFAFVASKRRPYYISPNGRIRERSFFKFEIIFPLLIFAVVFGMRYDVGVDHLTYLSRYMNNIEIEKDELFFVLIKRICTALNFHFVAYFSIWAFIQAFFFFYAFKKEKYLFPFLVFFLFANDTWATWMNLIRQSIAVCIWVFSLKYIEEKKPWKYIIWVAVGYLFHRSAIILFIFYPILRSGFDYFKNVTIQLALLVLAFMTGKVFFDIMPKLNFLFDIYLTLLGQEMYNTQSYNFDRALEWIVEPVGTGLGGKFRILVHIVIILYSSRLKKFYNSKKFDLVYFFFFLGLIPLYIIPSGSIALSRPFQYLYIFQSIMYAYFAYYLFKVKKYHTQIMYYALIIAFIGIFYLGQAISAEDSNRLYQFYFQHNKSW